jgi:hypothetical protein
MSWIEKSLFGFAMCALSAAVLAQTTAPTTMPKDTAPLVVLATPNKATVHPGDTLSFEVAIKNVSKDEQKIDVPNIIWAAGTDVPQITIPGWPARGGIGPAVTFRSVAIAAGDTFKNTWNANVSATAVPGDVALRVGVPLHRGGDKTWSEPLTIKIVAKEAPVAVDNPLYNAWKGQEKKTVTFTREETISGGAPIRGGGARAANQSTVTETCTKITDQQAEIEVKVGDAAAETLIVPAKLLPDNPELPKAAGTEDVKIGDKTYSCKKYTYYTSSKAEMGRDGQGLRGRATVWVADGIPGGIVQRDISLTIRVSYNMTDTLVPAK